MVVGLLAAALAAVAYGAGTILQAIGVGRLAAVASGAGTIERLRAGRAYGAGLGLDAVGFLASLAALRSLPLFLVESAVASSVAVTAVLAVLVLHMPVRRSEAVAIGGTLLGLVLLAASAEQGAGRALPLAARWCLLVGVPLLALLLVAGTGMRPDRAAGATLAATAGLGFGAVGIAAHTIVIPARWWRIVGDPCLWALAGFGVVSLVAFGYALHRGPVTTVATITFAVETVVPAAIGLIWLGDAVRPHLAPLAVLGFVTAVGSSIALAAHAVPEPVESEHAKTVVARR